MKTACRLWPSGASKPGSSALPSSVSTSIGFITLIPRGRSGQKKPRIACEIPHFAAPAAR